MGFEGAGGGGGPIKKGKWLITCIQTLFEDTF